MIPYSEESVRKRGQPASKIGEKSLVAVLSVRNDGRGRDPVSIDPAWANAGAFVPRDGGHD